MKNINSTKYLTIDCALTGFGLDLITSYMGVIKDDKIISELYLELIPDDEIFRVSPNSMAVNNIDLRSFKGTQYRYAKPKVYEFLKKAYEIDNQKLIPLGHGVGGDINIICNSIISKGSWENFVSLIPIDTLYIANFMRDIGKLKSDLISLQELIKYFNNIKGFTPHNAKDDALASYSIYKELQKLI